LAGTYRFDQFHTAEARCQLADKSAINKLAKTYFCETNDLTSVAPIPAVCTSADGENRYLFFKSADQCESVLGAQK